MHKIYHFTESSSQIGAFPFFLIGCDFNSSGGHPYEPKISSLIYDTQCDISDACKLTRPKTTLEFESHRILSQNFANFLFTFFSFKLCSLKKSKYGFL